MFPFHSEIGLLGCCQGIDPFRPNPVVRDTCGLLTLTLHGIGQGIQKVGDRKATHIGEANYKGQFKIIFPFDVVSSVVEAAAW